VKVDVAGSSRADLVDRFGGYPPRLADAAYVAEDREIPDGEWGPSEVVRHLIAVEREVWQSRLAQLIAQDRPRWAWVEPGPAEGFEATPLPSLLAVFTAARAVTIATIAALDEDDWARVGLHETLGELDLSGLVRLAIDHDEDHRAGLARHR
jgi:DinB superfamily